MVSPLEWKKKPWERGEGGRIWFSDLSDVAQRELVRLAMQFQLGRDPASVTGLTPFYGASPMGLLDDVTFDFEGVDVDDLGVDHATIVSRAWDYSRTSGEDEYIAHDLGDDLWYVTHMNSADEMEFVAVVPKSAADEAFRELQRAWLDELAFGNSGYPTHFYAVLGPWFIREVTLRVMAGEYSLWGHLDEHHAYYRGLPDDEAVARILSCAVISEPQGGSEQVVPGLAEWQETSPAFEDWFHRHTLRWRDTGESLDVEMARILRLVCLYLA